MFGVIFGLGIAVYLIYLSLANSYQDGQNKRKYKDISTNTYIDHDGVSRDLNTNRYRSITLDSHGDRHMWGKDIGDINLSQLDRKKEYEDYKDRLKRGEDIGRTTVFWEHSPFYKMGAKNILGNRYKDIATGDIFVVREHKHKAYYVSISDLKAIRYTDSQREFYKEKNKYDENTEIANIKDFQETIDKQRYDSSYIGDPTLGIGCYNETQLHDSWKPKKVIY